MLVPECLLQRSVLGGDEASGPQCRQGYIWRFHIWMLQEAWFHGYGQLPYSDWCVKGSCSERRETVRPEVSLRKPMKCSCTK